VRNIGFCAAQEVTVTDRLESGLTYVSDDMGSIGDANARTWTFASLASGDSIAIELNASIDSPCADVQMENAVDVDAVQCDQVNFPAHIIDAGSAFVDCDVTDVPFGSAKSFAVGFPRPNPTRGRLSLDFELPRTAHVVADIVDLQGHRVARVADASFPAGKHTMGWNGADERGHSLQAGMYFIRIQADRQQQTRRAILIR